MSEAPTIYQLVLMLGGPVAVYAAIRADLAQLKVRMERAEQDIQHIFKGNK
jgi:hypothetical protein